MDMWNNFQGSFQSSLDAAGNTSLLIIITCHKNIYNDSIVNRNLGVCKRVEDINPSNFQEGRFSAYTFAITNYIYVFI